MNIVAISGRLVYEPNPKQTDAGYTFMSSRVAVSRNDKNNTTDFFNIKAWNNTAKFIGQYFHKGDPIEIRGRLETSYREDSNGNKSNEVYILVEEVSFCLRPAEREPEPTYAEQAPTKPNNDMGQSVLDEGIADLLGDEPGTLPFDI